MPQRHDILWILASCMVFAAMIGVWEAIARSGIVAPLYLPSASRTFAVIQHGFADGYLLNLTLGTIRHMIFGWLLASLIGIALGSLIGISAAARAYLGPSLEFMRPLPASAMVPIGIALFGLTETMVLAVIAFGAVWPTLLATVHGFATLDQRLVDVSRVLAMSRIELIWKLALPNALPDILAGMRLSLSVALILAVLGEMLANRAGLGELILLSARSFRSAELFAGVILLGLIGLAASACLLAIERRALRWRSGH